MIDIVSHQNGRELVDLLPKGHAQNQAGTSKPIVRVY